MSQESPQAAPAPEAEPVFHLRSYGDVSASFLGAYAAKHSQPAPQAQAAGQDERADFEAWADDQGHSLEKHETGCYLDLRTEGAWWAWQARAAVSAANSLAQRQPLTEWQPIETAPKDGTLLLLWEQYESEPFIGSWYAFRSEWEASRTHYDTDGNAYVIDRVYSPGVTHWMPLPAAPAATTGKEPGGRNAA